MRHLAPLLQDRATEALIVMRLDADHMLVDQETIEGDVSRVIVRVDEILRRSVERRARELIVAHNHPSGSAVFSKADLILTKHIADGSRYLGIRLLDHLLFAATLVISARVEGLI